MSRELAMFLRSWLFVPADSPKKLARAADTGADAVILDLEDAVAPDAKGQARVLAQDWLVAQRQLPQDERKVSPWVRINAISAIGWRDDLAAIMVGAPDGIVLPKVTGPDDLQQLAAELWELEDRVRIPSGSTRIVALVGETPAAALRIAELVEASATRLAGLTWGAEDLGSAIGASRKHDGEGRWTEVFRFVRAQTLLTAHARSIMAIDTLVSDYADPVRLKAVAEASRADGFTGMLAIHPSQVAVINAAFTPSEAELDEARRIIAAFQANPNAGVLQLDHRMIDRPHLIQARRLLGMDGS
jgi:citrate lyase subunit beta / citryl-CoA lyase